MDFVDFGSIHIICDISMVYFTHPPISNNIAPYPSPPPLRAPCDVAWHFLKNESENSIILGTLKLRCDDRFTHAVAFSKKLRWLAQTKVISLKTQMHAVNSRRKRVSQRTFTLRLVIARWHFQFTNTTFFFYLVVKKRSHFSKKIIGKQDIWY